MTRTNSNPLAHTFDFVYQLRAQKRTQDGMFRFLKSLATGHPVKRACSDAGVQYGTYRTWAASYPDFKEQADLLIAANQAAFEAGVKARRAHRLEDKGLVFDPERVLPDKGDFTSFRWDFFGRPSPDHHREFIKVMETPAARCVIFLAPTGSGKDSIAGDAVAWLKADDRGENRVAWLMPTGDMAVRRLRRLSRYLTDARLYEVAPADTPGGQTPTRNLVDEFGPFKWHKDMVFPDGEKVPRATWTKNEMVFCGADVNEADADLSASGIDSDIYGNRIRTLVASDIFTLENQKNPMIRLDQMEKLRTTIQTRGDGRMREIYLGTMLPIENNWEQLIEDKVGTAGLLRSDEHVSWYRNGVVVIRHPAILHQGTERERSFWEERFPFQTTYVLHDGENEIRKALDDMTDQQVLDWQSQGATSIDGLKDIRGEPGTKQWNSFQATHQQIRVESADLADFTDRLLDSCDDPDRSYGILRPGEMTTIGADPARKNGAAYITWAVDTRDNTLTIVDEFWDTMLGADGIKTDLIMKPIQAWQPVWYGYEINKFEGELDDWTIADFLDAQPTNLYRHRTDAVNRSHDSLGPAQMVEYMRRRIIRFPAATPRDRERSARVKQQFKNWDRQSANPAARRRPGSGSPDDQCFAAWIGFIKGRELLERGRNRRALPKMPVPQSVANRWAQFQTGRDVTSRMKEAAAERATPVSLVTMFLQDTNTED